MVSLRDIFPKHLTSVQPPTGKEAETAHPASPLVQGFLRNEDVQLLYSVKNISSLKVKDGKFCRKNLGDYILSFIDIDYKNKRALVNRQVIQLVVLVHGLSENDPQALYHDSHLQQVIQDLFFTKIAQLHDIKLVGSLKKNNLLSKELENYLHPELAQLRQKMREQPALKDNEEEKLARRIARAKLALRLGVGIKSNKGATGTVIVLSLKGKNHGSAVFKPTDCHIARSTRLKNCFKKIFWGQLHFLNQQPDAQSKAEVAAYKTDRYFQFNLSPASQMTQLDNKEGAFQIFLKEGYKEAKKQLPTLEARVAFDQRELFLYQKSTIFDYLIGNLDRHEENWFVSLTPTGAIADLKVIDNANSFLRKNPLFRGHKNQYKWKNLQLSQHAFTPATRAFIHKKLGAVGDDQAILAFIAELKVSLPGFLDTAMENHLLQRAHILQKVAAQENFTPAQLGGLVTNRAMCAFLHS